MKRIIITEAGIDPPLVECYEQAGDAWDLITDDPDSLQESSKLLVKALIVLRNTR